MAIQSHENSEDLLELKWIIEYQDGQRYKRNKQSKCVSLLVKLLVSSVLQTLTLYSTVTRSDINIAILRSMARRRGNYDKYARKDHIHGAQSRNMRKKLEAFGSFCTFEVPKIHRPRSFWSQRVVSESGTNFATRLVQTRLYHWQSLRAIFLISREYKACDKHGLWLSPSTGLQSIRYQCLIDKGSYFLLLRLNSRPRMSQESVWSLLLLGPNSV